MFEISSMIRSKVVQGNASHSNKTQKRTVKSHMAILLYFYQVASVLIIIAIVVSLTQIFNIPFLRMGRGSNEIAPEDIDVTFDDVKGCEEAKQELQEIVEFLMRPVH